MCEAEPGSECETNIGPTAQCDAVSGRLSFYVFISTENFIGTWHCASIWDSNCSSSVLIEKYGNCIII